MTEDHFGDEKRYGWIEFGQSRRRLASTAWPASWVVVTIPYGTPTRRPDLISLCVAGKIPHHSKSWRLRVLRG